jgi:hypothetical protein
VSGASQTDSLADTRAHEPFALKMFIASTGYFTKRRGNFKLRKFSLNGVSQYHNAVACGCAQ